MQTDANCAEISMNESESESETEGERGFLYCIHFNKHFPREHRAWALPLPISNRVVKTCTADDIAPQWRVKVGHCEGLSKNFRLCREFFVMKNSKDSLKENTLSHSPSGECALTLGDARPQRKL